MNKQLTQKQLSEIRDRFKNLSWTDAYSAEDVADKYCDYGHALLSHIKELEAKLAECEVAINELALEATTAEDQLELAEMKLAEVAEKCIKVHKRA